MTNAETAAHLRKWSTAAHLTFAWPTDACGYEQHMRFVGYRNLYWDAFKGTSDEFLAEYARRLEAGDFGPDPTP
jgi:hypothetical protein